MRVVTKRALIAFWTVHPQAEGPLSSLATFRMRSSPDDTPVRPCVRGVAACSAFPLVDRLPSTASADRSSLPLFSGFPGTMQPSDFPETYMPGVWLPAFPDRPSPPSGEGIPGISRFPCMEFPHVRRVFDCAGPSDGLRLAPPSVWPSASLNSVGVPDNLISQLNGWPVRTPVNASPPASRPSTHDLGSVWGAIRGRRLAEAGGARILSVSCSSRKLRSHADV